MADKDKPVSSLSGNDRINLMNTNAQQVMKNVGMGDLYPHVIQASQATGGRVQPYEMVAAIARESSFNPRAKSSISSATGLGQFTKDTAKQLGINPLDPVQSINGMAQYLDQLKTRIGTDDPKKAQMAYMLGGGGYNKYIKGGKPAGANDVPQLLNKWESAINALESGYTDKSFWQGNLKGDKKFVANKYNEGDMSLTPPEMQSGNSGALSKFASPQATSEQGEDYFSQRRRALQEAANNFSGASERYNKTRNGSILSQLLNEQNGEQTA